MPASVREEDGRRGSSTGKSRWAAVFDEFSQTTTLHGLRYISDSTTFAVRRLIWLLLTLLCATILVYQIVDRVTYYYSSPISVNFRVNYNQSLAFPAVTICNQNAFRASSAFDHGWYRLVESVYRTNGEAHTGHPMDTGHSLPDTNLTMDQLFVKLGHRKEDFILRCEWAGEACSADNFTTILTDHGLCYTFNDVTTASRVYNVSSSGAEHGLSLTVNVERYEAMAGPNEAAGVKLLATDQAQFPRVEEIGHAISTGTHAFVGLGVLVINNLPAPHGDCGDKDLLSTRTYTMEMCTLECVTKFVVRRCGCKQFYMPDIGGGAPVCTVKQYLQCYNDAYDYIHKRTVELCDCPTYCHYRLYEPSITYAATSDNFKHQLLHAADSSKLKHSFHRAREITHRMNTHVLLEFERLVKQTSHSLESLKSILTHAVYERLANQISRLQEVTYNMTQALEDKNEIYKYQLYHIQKNFMRPRDAMEERTLNQLCLGFHEHVFDTEFKLRSLRDAKRNGTNDPEMLYLLLQNILKSKVETAIRALANYTQLYSSYETGENIFNYRFKRHPRSDNPYIVPRPLMNESLQHNKYARKYGPRLGRDIQLVMNASLDFLTLVDACSAEDTCDVNLNTMHIISEEFLESCEKYFHSKSTFYFESVDRPMRIIEKRINDFENLEHDYVQCRDSLLAALDTLNSSLRHIRERFLTELINYVEQAEEYFRDNATSNVTKIALAEAFTSQQVDKQLHTMQIFFADLRQRGNFVFQKWSELKNKSLKIWDVILNDKDSVEYYQYKHKNKDKYYKYKNIDAFLQNFTDMSESYEAYFTSVRDDNDLRFVIGDVDNQFLKAIEALIADLNSFLHSVQLDEHFVRENFIQLDVYFKELRHEQIDQQKAYSVIALLCDIGGAMGLFLGASAMTLFEILDFIANRTAENMSAKRRKQKKKQELYSLNSTAA